MAITRDEADRLSHALEDAGFSHTHAVPDVNAPSAHVIQITIRTLTSDQLGTLLGIIYPYGKDVTLEGNVATIH